MISLPPALRSLCRSNHVQSAVLFGLVLLSRLPFLDAGYGTNVDAWRVARVARDLALSGEYSVSRFPGYPVQEMVCSWFWRGGPVALNGLSAVLSAVAVTAFAAISRRLGFRHWWLNGAALAVTPLFFLSSVCAKDYVWALAFVLLAMFYALNSKTILAGMLLGLAAGCRITSLAMIPPIALIIFDSGATDDRRSRRCAAFVSVTTATAALAFTPVWLRYGWSFFTFYEAHARPSWPVILSRATIEVWGSVGLAILGAAFGIVLLRRRAITLTNRPILFAAILGITIYVAAYFRLPDQAGYLLPIVPLLLLVLMLLGAERATPFLFTALLFASFIDISGHGLVAGPIFADRNERLQTMQRIRDFVAYSQTLPGRNIIVVGAWEPQIAVMAPHLANSRNHYNYLLSEAEVQSLRKNGQRIFYLPAIRAFNYHYNGVDLAALGATDLVAVFHAQQTGDAASTND